MNARRPLGTKERARSKARTRKLRSLHDARAHLIAALFELDVKAGQRALANELQPSVKRIDAKLDTLRAEDER